MWARILCTSVPRDAARATVQLCSQLGHLDGHCLYNSSVSTCQVRSTASVHSQGTGLAVHKNAEPSVRAPHSSNQLSSRTAGDVSISTISSWAGSAGVICGRALFTATPCMWAAQTPQNEHSSAAGDAEACKITSKLTDCRSLAALSDVYSEWGGRFNAINTATALNMYAKLRRHREADTQLLPKLLRCWLLRLPAAGAQACANVLWALGKLDASLHDVWGASLDNVWEPTFAAFLRHVQQNTKAQSVKPQGISFVLWACAKLRKQPAPDQLAGLMQAVLLPEVLAAATPQALANIAWALGRLCQLKGWQGDVREEAIQQLLGEQQLQILSATGTGQNISNVLLGVTDMATAAPPVISKAFAQQCSRQLLADSCQRLGASDVQHVCNTLYVCAELQLAQEPFLTAAAASAAQWVPTSQLQNVLQAATACAKLQFRHQGLMTALLQRGQQLLQPSGAQGRQQRTLGKQQGTQPMRTLGPRDKDILAGILCSAVAYLDMQELAPQALQLVADSGICQRPNTHPSNLRRLWVFHGWLLQHQLAGGQGLTGLLTQQQRQRGEREAAQYPDMF